MPVEKIEIGEHIYLWADPNKRSNDCVISAHGKPSFFRGHVELKDKTFRTPDLHYFTPHGTPTEDHSMGIGLREWIRRPSYEVLPADQSPDYTLTKFTNSNNVTGNLHNEGGESYNSIMFEAMRREFDIVTIRYRASDVVDNYIPNPLAGIKLSEVLNVLEAEGYHYTDYYCAFCRG